MPHSARLKEWLRRWTRREKLIDLAAAIIRLIAALITLFLAIRYGLQG